jgi:hypothetical protein
MNICDSSLDFRQRLSIIDKNTTKEAKKTIHFKSIRNFIYHYDSFKKRKMTATEWLDEYFEYIEKENYCLSKEQSIEAYSKYIAPLGRQIYSRYLNFSSAFAFSFQFFLYIVPNSLLWIQFHSYSLLLYVLPFYMVYWINYIIKYQKFKIYGFRY